MNKFKYWAVMFFLTTGVVLFSLIFIEDDDIPKISINNNSEPTYTGDHSTTLVYSPKGILNYRLIVQHVEHFSERGVSWLTQPVLTTYNTNETPTWLIRSKHATLTSNHILYLKGDVEIHSLVVTIPLKITTDSATIDLVTQDVMSRDFVTLHGKIFNFKGVGMQGNLRNQQAKLADKVEACYEIQRR